MDELVSIIMPSFNTASYIGETIESVMAQTYTNWELLIVDDCSTDNTDEVVSSVRDERIYYLKNSKNSGAAISRNKALLVAKGRWIAFLDSDDLWLPEKLERQIKYMLLNDYKFTFTDYRVALPNGKASAYICTGPNRVSKKKLYQYCYFSTITVIYDANAVGVIQIEDIKKNNDYAMWFQAVEKVDCYRFPECLSIYCKRQDSISSGSKIKLIKHHYILYKKALHKGKLLSIVLTVGNLFFGILKKIYYRKYC